MHRGNMEKILVAIDGRHGAWAALSHACSLAKRVQVDLNVLLVAPPSPGKGDDRDDGIGQAIRKRLELLLETAKSEGIAINYFITEGQYEEEVINFVTQHKVALLIHEAREREARLAAREVAALRALRHRLMCTMEIVAPIKNIPE